MLRPDPTKFWNLDPDPTIFWKPDPGPISFQTPYPTESPGSGRIRPYFKYRIKIRSITSSMIRSHFKSQIRPNQPDLTGSDQITRIWPYFGNRICTSLQNPNPTKRPGSRSATLMYCKCVGLGNIVIQGSDHSSVIGQLIFFLRNTQGEHMIWSEGGTGSPG